MADIESIALTGLNGAAGRVAAAATVIAAGAAAPVKGAAAADPIANAVFQQDRLQARQVPNFSDADLAGAAIDMKLGQVAYAANAAVLRSQTELEREFIRDIRI